MFYSHSGDIMFFVRGIITPNPSPLADSNGRFLSQLFCVCSTDEIITACAMKVRLR